MAPTKPLARKLAIYWRVHPINLGQKMVEARMEAGMALLKKQKVVHIAEVLANRGDHP